MKLSIAIASLFAVASLAAPIDVADTQTLAKRCARPNGNCGKDTAYNIAKSVAEIKEPIMVAVEKRCNLPTCIKDTAYRIY